MEKRGRLNAVPFEMRGVVRDKNKWLCSHDANSVHLVDTYLVRLLNPRTAELFGQQS